MKEQIKKCVRSNMLKKKIILFGAGNVAKIFYEEYKNILNISHCVSNIKKEWGEKKFLDELDVKRFDKKDIHDEYIIVCGPIVFKSIELQLQAEGFNMYDDFVESYIASAIFQNKKIALFYGQCVLRDIYRCMIHIPEFSEEYAAIWAVAGHKQSTIMNRILYYTKDICDLYLYTPKILDLDSIYFLSPTELPKGCKIVSVSNLSVSLYWPQVNTRLNEYNRWYLHPYNAKRDLNFFHSLYRRDDCNINKMLLEGKSTNEIIKRLSDDNYYTKKQIKKNENLSLKLIDIAEKNVSITVGDYIKDNYQTTLLYQNFLHPNKNIIWQYVKKILKEIEITVDNINLLEAESPEHIHHGGDVPIYPSVAKHMDLKCVNQNTIYEIMTGKGIEYMTYEQYMEHFIEYTRKTMEILRIW